ILDLAWWIYLAIAAALLLRLIAGAFSALRLWRTADPVLTPLAADLAPGGILRSSPRVSSPANVGSGIVLPPDYGEWSDEKLRVVLAHEREHVRQGDFYLQLLAGLYSALTWFSPLGWWLKRKLSELGEAMSDCAGLEEAASPSSYAQMLLEFAALPRPLRAGVAMARAGRLTSRIERLLNDAAFRQAFTAGGRRTLLALVIAPLALLASAALVRIQAAGQAPAPPPHTSAETSAQTPAQAQNSQASQQTGVSNPPAPADDDKDQHQPTPSPAPPPNAAAEPSPAPPAAQAPEPAPAPAAGADAGEGSGSGQGQGAGTGAGMQPLPPAPAAPGQVPVPPVPPIHVQVPPVPPIDVNMPPMPNVNPEVGKALRQRGAIRKNIYFFHNGPYYAFDGGEPWALVPAQGAPIMNTRPLSGADRAEIDKARGTAHAPFFWFKHEGKSYIVEDPSLVAQVETLEKPVEDMRSQMRALGKQQRALGEQMRQKMRAQRQQPIPKPDLSRQMAELNAAVDSLKASQGETVTRAQLANLQKQVAQLQGQIFRAESGFYNQNGQSGAEMGAFGKQMGQLGAEQGRLAGEMTRMSMDSRAKIDDIIKQSLSDRKAKPLNAQPPN
ncbi:MAG: M56 family metallopeptidase, partial [Terracidiphilus sp.]